MGKRTLRLLTDNKMWPHGVPPASRTHWRQHATGAQVLLLAGFCAAALIGCREQLPQRDFGELQTNRPEKKMTDREKLIAKIEAQNPSGELQEIVVSLEDFFTGNNDTGSIGVNLGPDQPPITKFHRVLREIRARPNVQDVLVRIYDYDDPTSWPYTDTVYIITRKLI